MPVGSTFLLSSSEGLLFRQVVKEFVLVDGSISSQAFRDEIPPDFQLSADRSSLTSPEGAFRLAERLGVATTGVWGFTVDECSSADVCAYADPDEGTGNAAHAVVDFQPLTRKKRTSVSKMLRNYATERGRLFP